MADQTDVRSFELAGKKLGLLLSSAPFPANIRQSWADLLPFMDIDQMAELSRQLELLVIGRPSKLEIELIKEQILAKPKKIVKKKVKKTVSKAKKKIKTKK